ncbi:hypothetical protein DNX69_11280 [Rhodopseudomonas palustris]|uniref:Heavy-metal-associated domain-containing protein n=1 Tax=Rhodopseudomonas palustris TaxID=1076 RepID=A0A323UH66_RHOPL|nr:hypothetical protein [Rhodopseudomonas palustris]PZA11701.1 hypothetical protein DNX69_11280 [Rhodopseudomonas palustris]
MTHLVHRLPGRLRFKVPQLRRDPGVAERFRKAVEQAAPLAGVRIEVNLRASSVIVAFDAKLVSSETILAAIVHEGLTGAVPAVAPPPPRGVILAVGSAIGHAMFGAAIKTGVEKSVAGLIGKLARR